MADLTPPQATRKDRVLGLAKRTAKGLAGAVPVVGSAVTEVVDHFFRLPLEERREKWLSDMAAMVEELREHHPEIDVAELESDPEFITTLHRATDIALRTHQQEKLDALRAAVLHSALPSAPEMDMRSFFLQLVEELSPTHLRILALYNDPPRWLESHDIPAPNLYAGSRLEVLKLSYPDLARDDQWRVFVGQLEARGLMGGITGMVTGRAILDAATTPLGRSFLEFITASGG